MTFGNLTLVAAGALATGLAFPASAQKMTAPAPDPVVVAPVYVAPAYDWTGFYAGAQLGWGSGSADTGAADIDHDGAIGGLNVGYRHDFGQFVLGGEAQYDWANLDLDDDAGSIDNVARLKAIAGYDAGRSLVYGSAGWTRASAEVGGEDYSDSGWVIGAGMDYLVTDRVTLGGEIQYHRFDDFDDTGIDVDATTIQAKMTFRF